MGAIWGVWEACWGPLGGSCKRLGGLLGRLGASWGAPGGVLGASWGRLGATFGAPKRVLEASWGYFWCRILFCTFSKGRKPKNPVKTNAFFDTFCCGARNLRSKRREARFIRNVFVRFVSVLERFGPLGMRLGAFWCAWKASRGPCARLASVWGGLSAPPKCQKP